MNNQQTLKIGFKKLHPNAVAPTRAHEHDAGWDLTAIDYRYNSTLNLYVYETGIGVAIPPGYVGLIFPRSSARKYGLQLANSVGVIDSGYTGDLTFSYRIAIGSDAKYQPGDRIGQIVILPLPAVEMVEVEDLGQTARGANGHGSTGK